MLNSKFGLRQAANVVSAAGDQLGNLTSSTNVNTSSQATTNNSYVIAKYDYQSQGPQELSIRKGDKLLLIDDRRHWWKVVNSENLTGFVPSNYVKREKQSLFDSIRRGIRVNTKSKKSPLTATEQSPSSSPLISKSSLSDITTLSPDHEQNFSFKRPYVGSNSDNAGFPSRSNQPQSHSDILVRELGPDFNGSSLSQNDNNKSNNSNNNNDLMGLQEDSSSLLHNLNCSIATVKYNYKSQQPDELSLTKGTKISVLEKSEDGWWKGELDGKIGWFPSNYVVEKSVNELEEQNTNDPKLETPIKLVQSKQNVVSSNYPFNCNTDLTNIIDNSTKNEPCNNNNNSSQLNQFDNDDTSEVLFVVVALYSFQSQNNEELSFAKDERLDIIEKPTNDPDWWRACNQLGETGLVPKNYVQIVPKVKSIRSWSAKSPTKKLADNSFLTSTTGTGNFGNNSAVNVTSQFMHDNTLNDRESILGKQTNQGDVNGSLGNANSSLAHLAHDLEIKLKLNDKNWYHGVMSRQQCDQLLNAYAEDGDFLIRNSETSAGDFSVSLKAPVRNKHFRVHYVDDSFCIGQRKFDSLDELVEHYKRTPIYTSATGEKMFLKKAYSR